MTNKNSDQSFTPAETSRRVEAALRGARIAGPQHKESVTPKAKGLQQQKRKRKRS
jgi:hypothetical protein